MKPTRGHGRFHQPDGFTLAELVIVVLIIGILSAATVPKLLDSVELYHAEAAAKRIKIDIEMARRVAKSNSAAQLIDFDTVNHSYTLPGVPDLKHAGSNYTVDLTVAPYASSLAVVNFNGGDDVTFDGYGVPDNAGTIEVRAGSYRRIISVEATTGKVTIQ
ncbi:MAG: prepilin-type N-terminal cleavage/methylation domain-containing protein [Planctomycetota bacterium]|nr:prepilin-type N-terminal cleavage/methylation domain-containing protein [Planctomycetota bacterium]